MKLLPLFIYLMTFYSINELFQDVVSKIFILILRAPTMYGKQCLQTFHFLVVIYNVPFSNKLKSPAYPIINFSLFI